MKSQYPAKPNSNQKSIIKRRGLNPNDYLVLKETYASLHLKNIHTGFVKIIIKYN